MTQIDIAPTVLGLLGLPYEAPFFGIDALHESPEHSRIALFSHNHDVAILRDNELVVLGLGKTHQSLTYDPIANSFKPRRGRRGPGGARHRVFPDGVRPVQDEPLQLI